MSDTTNRIEPFPPRTLRSAAGVEVTLRGAARSDGAAILEIISLVTAEGFYFISQPDELHTTVQQAEDWIEGQLEKPGNLIVVAQVQDQVVGFAEFERGRRRRVAHLGQMSIYLKKQWRNLGIGSLLMQLLLDWAEQDPAIEKVCLSVFASNQRAVHFYRKFGFQQEGRKIREYKLDSTTYDDDVMMYRFVKLSNTTV